MSFISKTCNYIKPEQVTNHNYITEDALYFFDDLTTETKHPKNFAIYIKTKRGKFKRVACLRRNDFMNFVQEMHISPTRNYYIVKNPSKNGERKAESMCSLENIVIDIDCHVAGIESDKLRPELDALMNYLTNSVFEERLVPLPNYVVYTGRGLQMWWQFEPNIVTECYLAKFNAVKENWINQFEQALMGFHAEYPLNVDRGASKNNMGLVRMPGSYNTKTGALTEIEQYYYERYDLHREYDNRAEDTIKAQKTKRFTKRDNQGYTWCKRMTANIIIKI